MSMARIVIAGTQSGVGKTSLTVGLAALFRRRGLRVQTFKVGPDYLDPTWLAQASGRPCYNLDGWMTGREYVEGLFDRATDGADLALIEGVMGLFDGADPASSEGSTAEVARWLEAPVLLVANVHGLARSLAAMVHGYTHFENGLRVAGVIANQCGSERHARWLAESLRSASLPPLVGAVERGSLPEIPRRHLGLVTSSLAGRPSDFFERLADALGKSLDNEAILQKARAAPARGRSMRVRPAGSKRSCRLGIARDEAFHFYYPDNLEALEHAGCELVSFSPIKDRALPEKLDGLYLGGGYPEEHAAALSENRGMIEEIRRFAKGGGAIYAECGGLMYLSEGIEATDGMRHPLAGLLPGWTRMSGRRKALGYVEVEMREATFWGARGTRLRGHEFHYSELLDGPSGDPCWETVYEVRHRGSAHAVREGFQNGRILATYLHAHFASHPTAAQEFVRHLLIHLPPSPADSTLKGAGCIQPNS